MAKAVMIRRPGWGVDFGKMVNHCSDVIRSVNVKRVAKLPAEQLDVDYVINWGFTDVQLDDVPVLNGREAVSLASNKGAFRKKCMKEDPDIVPKTWFNVFDGGIKLPCIVRPARHKQGRMLYYVDTDPKLGEAAALCGVGYYISEYIKKTAEYRVFVVDGRVAMVSKKVVENPDAIAWNHAAGDCEFVNVNWDAWPLGACDVALRAFALTGLDFAGVDVMVDDTGRAYVLEVNSAISLPFLDDGEDFEDRISYTQRKMLKCLEWRVEGKDSTYDYKGRKENSYHKYIHAAMKEKADV